ncbi:phosphoglycerate kinase [Candidatus Woesearchaeota archaeon]|jgi:3-phosphoglycerate kinase|nr:phosphoglycerate kinase [Candidatus Woesearchaeota archaeon]
MKRFILATFPIKNKTVFLRVDYNVPIKDGIVLDNHKIINSLPTINFLLSNNCKIILATHLGKPRGNVVPELKVNPLAKELSILIKKKVVKLDDCIGEEIKEKIETSKAKIFMLENLRFYKDEEQNSPAFAHSLADLANVYVNDAFAVCHRQHASVEAITHFLPSIPGLSLEKEIFFLKKAIVPKKPAVWIMGGAKLNKIDLIKQALKKADNILIGGALCFAFMKAKGIKVGMSKVDSNSVIIAKKVLRKWSADKIVLPIDFIVTEKLSPSAKPIIVRYNKIRPQQTALDIGPQTIALFKNKLAKTKTIIWNGPLGYFEWAKFAQGTKEIGRFLGKLKAIKIAGGGETAEAMHKFHLAHNFTHLSTGGGAALTFLAKQKMPGIDALENNYKKFKV